MNLLQTLWIFLRGSTVTFPSGEVLLLISVLTISLLYRAKRIGLLFAYLFAYRWGWLVVSEGNTEYQAWILGAYLIFGMAVGIIAVVRLYLWPSDRED